MSSQRIVGSYMLHIKQSVVTGLTLVPLLAAGAWLTMLVRDTGPASDSCPVVRVDVDPLAAGIVIRACGEIEVAGRALTLHYDVRIELTGGRLPAPLRRPPR